MRINIPLAEVRGKWERRAILILTILPFTLIALALGAACGALEWVLKLWATVPVAWHGRERRR